MIITQLMFSSLDIGEFIMEVLSLKQQLVGFRKELMQLENLNECNRQVLPLLLRCGPPRHQSPSLQCRSV